MTLLISVFAAVISTVVWYKNAPKDEMKTGILCYMFWGASIMWLVDAVFEYKEIGTALFRPEPTEMLYDAFLGFSVIALALVIWIVIVLIKDPKGAIKEILFKKK